MHQEILAEEQIKLLNFVKKFSRDYFLVGGTAIALQIGHRRSIDFYLFTNNEFENNKIRNIVKRNNLKIGRVYKDEFGQFTFFINKVQFTFFLYPFKIKSPIIFEKLIKMPDLLSLAAMKAHALSRRAKWKDYVDLYFILSNHFSVEQISAKSKKLFGNEFNGRIFREALAYFDDINYSEPVEWMPGFEVSDKKIKKALIEFSIS